MLQSIEILNKEEAKRIKEGIRLRKCLRESQKQNENTTLKEIPIDIFNKLIKKGKEYKKIKNSIK